LEEHVTITEGPPSEGPTPRINLWNAIGLGLILAYPSGIHYSNQVCGHACLHPTLEGIYVPLANDILENGTLISPATDLWQYFTGPKLLGMGAPQGLDQRDADVIDAILARYRIDTLLTVDRLRLGESYEAWVWVKVLDNEGPTALINGGGPYPRRGVITWPNSD
jgi:hypothetical protein